MRARTADNEFAFRHYDPDEIVMGKRMEDHLRFAVAYWHSFAWQGGDPFGGQTFDRPWFGETMDHARLKADVAFEMFGILDAPFFCFHDADIRPEGADLRREPEELRGDRRSLRREDGGQPHASCSWGTANLFTHRRFMSGAATNPDPDVFAYVGGDGEGLHGRDAQAGRRRTTSSGAGAKATRRCSTPT